MGSRLFRVDRVLFEFLLAEGSGDKEGVLIRLLRRSLTSSISFETVERNSAISDLNKN